MGLCAANAPKPGMFWGGYEVKLRYNPVVCTPSQMKNPRSPLKFMRYRTNFMGSRTKIIRRRMKFTGRPVNFMRWPMRYWRWRTASKVSTAVAMLTLSESM